MEKMCLEDIKAISLYLLENLDDFCQERSINYTLCFGTLLGAVRHRGFIPWDDDIDIIMPRPDYERFCKEWKDTKDVSLFSYNRKNTHIAYARLTEMKRTVVTSPAIWNKAKESGVWIDIFPIDAVEDNDKDANNRIGKSREILSDVMNSRFVLTTTKKSFKSYIKHLVLRLIHRENSNEYYLKQHDNLCKEIDYITAKRISILSFATTGYKGWFDINMFKELISVDFENHSFKCIKDWDKYLKLTYGDYMELPPIEKRVQTHSAHKYYWK